MSDKFHEAVRRNEEVYVIEASMIYREQWSTPVHWCQ